MKKNLLFVLALIWGLGSVQKMQAAAEIYAVATPEGDATTLTLYYDEQRETRGGVTDWRVYNNCEVDDPARASNNVTKFVLHESMKAARPTSTAMWFYYFRKLTTIEHLDYLNTSEVENMRVMFFLCQKLNPIDVSKFNTAKVTDMYDLFSGCESVKELDVSGFDVSKVKQMSGMFDDCYCLESLNLSNFNTSEVIDMAAMFADCEKLETLNLSSFNTENVKEMGSMFKGCKALKSLDLRSFKTDKVEQMGYMFKDCSSLETLDVSSFNTEKVTSMWCMFEDCKELTTLNLQGFNPKSLTGCGNMFSGCTKLKTIKCFYDWSKNENLTSSSAGYMFWGCSALVGEAGTAYSTTYDSSVSKAHLDGGASNPGYFTDPREVVTSVSFTGFEDFFEVGMTWNSTAEAALAAQIEPETGAAYTWLGSMEILLKWDQSLKEGAGDWKKVASGEEITYGKYYFGVQVRIEGANAKLYRMPKDGETAMTVLVDGTPWLPADAAATIEPTYSCQWIYSPAFEFLEPEKITAVAYTGFEGQIQLGTVWDSDKKIAVAEAFAHAEMEYHWTINKPSATLYKKNAADEWEEVSDATITTGTYQFEIWMASQNAKEYRFPSDKNDVTATIDGKAWNIKETLNTETSSWLKIYSPAFDIVDPAAAKVELKAVCDDLEAILDFADKCGIPNDYTKDLNTAYLGAWAVYTKLDATYAEVVAATTAATTAKTGAITALKTYGPIALKAELAGFLLPTDSQACKDIVTDAQAEVDKLAWDDAKSVTENIAALQPVIEALLKDTEDALNAQRASDATGMESIQQSAVSIQKVIENGVLYILRDGKMYNAQGKEVK